jgi:hypothetical protein
MEMTDDAIAGVIAIDPNAPVNMHTAINLRLISAIKSSPNS